MLSAAKTDSVTSYIEPHEIKEAQALIEGNMKFPMPRVCGFNMLVKIHVREEDLYECKDKHGKPIIGSNGRPVKIAIPPAIRASEKYRSCTALVLAQGPRCYTEEEYKESGPLCRVGDFIVFPRNECRGSQFSYRGFPVQVITDKCVYQVIKCPTDIVRYRVMLG